LESPFLLFSFPARSAAGNLTGLSQSGFFVGDDMQTPALQAQLDWITTGEFNPDQFTGDDRKAYNEAASAILRQWDNQNK